MTVKGSPHRIGKTDLDVFVAFFKCQRHTGKRTTGANSTNKAIDFAIGLFPDFWCRGVDMTLTVGDIVELVGPDRAIGLRLCQFFGQTARHMNIVVLIAVRHGRDFAQIRPQKTQ